MELNEFQAHALDTAVYPGRWSFGGVIYTSLGLAGEGGEVADKVKKVIRDDEGVLTDATQAAIISEIGDVLWYAALLSDELGVTLDEVAAVNIAKLASRAERNVLVGSGDDR